jgi:hypothetical protein
MRKAFRTIFFTALTLGVPLASSPLRAQATAAATDDKIYYDFWPGTWYEIENGVRKTRPSFVVKRGVQPTAYVEDWLLTVDGKDDASMGLRVWDPATSRWSFVWTNARGLYQIWDSVKVGKDWYIQRPFEAKGQRWLSRQAWIPDGANAVTWVMERSEDNGQTWQLRARTRFERGSG